MLAAHPTRGAQPANNGTARAVSRLEVSGQKLNLYLPMHRLATHLTTRSCPLSTSCGDMSMTALFAPRPDHCIVCFVLHLCGSKQMLRLYHRRRRDNSLRRLPIRTVITVSPGAWQLYRTVSDIGPSDDSCPPLRISPPTRGEQISGSAFTTGSLKSTVTSLHT